MPKYELKHAEKVLDLMRYADIYRDARSSWAGEVREQLAMRIDLVIEEVSRKAVKESDDLQAEFVGPERPVKATVRKDGEESDYLPTVRDTKDRPWSGAPWLGGKVCTKFV